MINLLALGIIVIVWIFVFYVLVNKRVVFDHKNETLIFNRFLWIKKIKKEDVESWWVDMPSKTSVLLNIGAKPKLIIKLKNGQRYNYWLATAVTLGDSVKIPELNYDENILVKFKKFFGGDIKFVKSTRVWMWQW